MRAKRYKNTTFLFFSLIFLFFFPCLAVSISEMWSRKVEYAVGCQALSNLGLEADPARPSEAEALCLSSLAGLSGEILKYKNVFQIIRLVIIPAHYLEALRHESEIFDSCLLYYSQFKLYLSKMLSESAASNSFLVLNTPMSHRRIGNLFCHISS